METTDCTFAFVTFFPPTNWPIVRKLWFSYWWNCCECSPLKITLLAMKVLRFLIYLADENEKVNYMFGSESSCDPYRSLHRTCNIRVMEFFVGSNLWSAVLWYVVRETLAREIIGIGEMMAITVFMRLFLMHGAYKHWRRYGANDYPCGRMGDM